jgi:hypothetical protein
MDPFFRDFCLVFFRLFLFYRTVLLDCGSDRRAIRIEIVVQCGIKDAELSRDGGRDDADPSDVQTIIHKTDRKPCSVIKYTFILVVDHPASYAIDRIRRLRSTHEIILGIIRVGLYINTHKTQDGEDAALDTTIRGAAILTRDTVDRACLEIKTPPIKRIRRAIRHRFSIKKKTLFFYWIENIIFFFYTVTYEINSKSRYIGSSTTRKEEEAFDLGVPRARTISPVRVLDRDSDPGHVHNINRAEAHCILLQHISFQIDHFPLISIIAERHHPKVL